MQEAFATWLQSVKALPSVFALKLAPIYTLFYLLPQSRNTDERILALKQGIGALEFFIAHQQALHALGDLLDGGLWLHSATL